MLQNLKTFFYFFLKPFGVGFIFGPGTLKGSSSLGSIRGGVFGFGTTVGLGRTSGWGEFKLLSILLVLSWLFSCHPSWL